MGFIARLAQFIRGPMRPTVRLAPQFDPVRHAVDAALEIADRDGKSIATVDDLVWALAFENEVEALLQRLHPSVEIVRDALSLARSGSAGNLGLENGPNDDAFEERLSTSARVQIQSGPPNVFLDQQFLAVLRHAAAQSLGRGERTIGVTDTFLACLQMHSLPSIAALANLGITRFSTTMTIAHGVPSHQLDFTVLPHTGDLLVVMWNDRFTTMEFVLEVLTKRFKLDEGEAKGIMMEVHNHGRATVAIWPAPKAKEVVVEVLAMAKDEGLPLKMSLERAH